MMNLRRLLLAFALCASSVSPGEAVEGPAVAGPIGGTDLRSAQLPPPGLYGGVVGVAAGTLDFVDGDGKTIPALRDAHLTRNLAGAFLFHVPGFKVLGGSVGVGGLVPVGNSCGSLFIGEKDRCANAFGDPYFELDWSRFFGKVRASKHPGAYPIAEGLTALAGFGLVVPLGPYDDSRPLEQAISIATNIWDFAPTVGVTYMTPPILAEGTEVSAKVYWNNYLENPDTKYLTGDVINVDFAVTERMGRLQAGLAGFYAVQIEDDRIAGVRAPPDGRRAETLQLGGVVNYDMPEHAMSLKFKASRTVFSENTVESWAVVLGAVQKF